MQASSYASSPARRRWRTRRTLTTCACATAYLAKPWLELHEFVADAASSAGEGGGGGGGWSAHLAQFMGENGYRLHYPGAVLCRRADDPRAPPLAGASEVERVLSR